MSGTDNVVSLLAEKVAREPTMTEEQREAARRRIVYPLEVLLAIKKIELSVSHMTLDMFIESYSARKGLDDLADIEAAINDDLKKRIESLKLRLARKLTGNERLSQKDGDYERFLIRESIHRRKRREEQKQNQQ